MRNPSRVPAARGRARAASLEVLEPRVFFAAGQLDPAFGQDGRLTVQFPGGQALTVVRDSVVQGDGKIVISGETPDTDPAAEANATDFAVARLNPDGTPDTTFSGDGIVVFHDVGNTEVATGVAMQSDGKIVASGLFSNNDANGVPEYSFFGVLRFNPDGTPDTTWGVGGVVVTVFGDPDAPADAGSDVLVGADGKITAIGTQTSLATGVSQIALARYNPADGSLDPAFGDGGKALARISREAEAGVAGIFLADGKLLVTGSAFDLPTVDTTAFTAGFITARFNPDGSVDTAFGDGGAVVTDFPRRSGSVSFAAADAITLQADGRILVGGLVARDVGGGSSIRVALARYSPEGTLDLSFGKRGLVESNLGLMTSVNQIMVDDDGRIVCSGLAAASDEDVEAGRFSALVLQYGADGKLDKTFGNGGRVIVDPPGASAASARGGEAGFDGLRLAAAFGAFRDAPLRGTAQVGTGEGFQDVLRRQAAVLIALEDRILIISAANEQLNAAQLIGNGADLVVASVAVKARPVTAGGNGSANVRVSNAGNEPVPGTTEVLLLLSTDQTLDAGDRTAASLTLANNLNPRRRKSLRYRFLFPTDLPEGIYYLLAVSDPGTTDVTAGNNLAVSAAQVTVTGAG